MSNSGLFDYSRAEDIRLDEISLNSRTGYNFAATAVNGGTLPVNVLGTNWMQGFGTPSSVSSGVAQTLTAAQLSTGIIVINATSALTATFDTAANIVGMVNARSAGAVVGDIVQCLIINGQGTNTITLAAGSGGAYDTNQTASSRIIAGNTSKFVFIRLTNVTGGSEAYVIYS